MVHPTSSDPACAQKNYLDVEDCVLSKYDLDDVRLKFLISKSTCHRKKTWTGPTTPAFTEIASCGVPAQIELDVQSDSPIEF